MMEVVAEVHVPLPRHVRPTRPYRPSRTTSPQFYKSRSSGLKRFRINHILVIPTGEFPRRAQLELPEARLTERAYKTFRPRHRTKHRPK
jgi:hypothetical protein